MATIAVTIGKINNHPKKSALALGLSLLIACAIVAGALIYATHNNTPKLSKAAQAAQETKLANKAILKGNKAQALKYAKKALADAPNNISNIQLVAYLTKTQDPAAAKQYYVQAFDIYKQQNSFNGVNVTAVNYWAAAGMAMQAGETAQAKQYYQKVIQTARPSNSYEQSIAKQSRADLARLQ